MKILHPFEPVVNEECEILVLGSFPSVISRENEFYYGNPKNRFWPLLSGITGTDFTVLSSEEKRSALLKHNIALYDAVYSCEIEGSSDSSIRNVVYSDIPSLIQKTKVKRILCNGKKAYSLFLKKYPEYQNMTISLPSTSPANAAWSMERLKEEWEKYI